MHQPLFASALVLSLLLPDASRDQLKQVREDASHESDEREALLDPTTQSRWRHAMTNVKTQMSSLITRDGRSGCNSLNTSPLLFAPAKFPSPMPTFSLDMPFGDFSDSLMRGLGDLGHWKCIQVNCYEMDLATLHVGSLKAKANHLAMREIIRCLSHAHLHL